MPVIEIFRNDILSKNGKLHASILFVPSRCFNNDRLLVSSKIADDFRSDQELVKVSASKLWGTIPRILFFHEMISSDNKDSSDEHSEYDFVPHGGREFCEEVLYGKHVIFENSPLSMDSIAGLVQKSTGMALGAYVGFLERRKAHNLAISSDAKNRAAERSVISLLK